MIVSQTTNKDNLKKIRFIIRIDQQRIPTFLDQTSGSHQTNFYLYQELYSYLLFLIVDRVLNDKQIELTFQKFFFVITQLNVSNIGIDLIRSFEFNLNDYKQLLMDDECFEAIVNINKLYENLK